MTPAWASDAGREEGVESRFERVCPCGAAAGLHFTRGESRKLWSFLGHRLRLPQPARLSVMSQSCTQGGGT